MVKSVKNIISGTVDFFKKSDSVYDKSRDISSGDRVKLEALEPIVLNSFQSMIDVCDEHDITYHEGGIRKIAMYLRLHYDASHNSKEEIEKELKRCIKKFIFEFKDNKRTVNIDNWGSRSGVTETAWGMYLAEVGIWRYKEADS